MVELWTNRDERMAVGAELGAGGRSLVVASAARQPGSGAQARWLVSFEGVGSREAAESLRDRVLTADAIDVEGALWVHELVGSQLHQPDGEPVGRVEAVEANPASDLLLLDDGRVIPLTFVTRDDSGRLIVDGPPGLLDPP